LLKGVRSRPVLAGSFAESLPDRTDAELIAAVLRAKKLAPLHGRREITGDN
jgi:hypothetical protein